MKAEIIRIGNSHGVRIPKPILEQCGLHGLVEMDVRQGKLIIAPAQVVRSGWADAFQSMAEAGDDQPLMSDEYTSQWDEKEWQW